MRCSSFCQHRLPHWHLAWLLAVGVAASAAAAPFEPVDAEATRESVQVRLSVDRADPYQDERVLLRTRVYFGAELIEGALSDPAVEGAVVERVGDDRSIQTEIDGRRYRGIERTYAVYPDAPGPLVVPPVRFQGLVRSEPRPALRAPGRGADRPGSPQPQSPFGPGFASDWFDDFFAGRMPLGDAFSDRLADRFARFLVGVPQRVTVHSDPLTLRVRPRPAEAAGAWWLPARALALEEHWDPEPESVRVGEALVRRIGLHGAGVGSAQLPPLELPEVAGAKQYLEAPRVTETAVGTSRVQEVTVIPTKPGPLALPAVEVEWWDTDADAPRIAVLPARTVEVLPGPAGTVSEMTPDAAAASAADASALPRESPVPPRTVWEMRGSIAAGAAALGLAGFAVGASLRRTARGARSTTRRAAERALRRACARSDAAAAEAALRVIARASAPAARPARGDDLERWARENGETELAEGLAALWGVRYSDAGDHRWDGEALWKTYRATRARTRRAAAHRQRQEGGLPPLYPGGTATEVAP